MVVGEVSNDETYQIPCYQDDSESYTSGSAICHMKVEIIKAIYTAS